MKAAIKVDILITAFILFQLLLVFTAINAWAQIKNDCGASPYTMEIIEISQNGSCYDVHVVFSFDDHVDYELSHVTIDFGKGKISDAWNSEGWKMEMNQFDPSSLTYGLKIDDIQNFGKDQNFTSFEAKFTFCPGKECNIDEGLNPKVAYKAGQCIYYEYVNNPFPNEENPNPDEENPDTDDQDPNPDQQTPLAVTVDKADPTCMAFSGGSIHLVISGGTEPYAVNWDSGNIGINLSNLSAGTYAYTITDADNNQLLGEVMLEGPSGLVINASLTNPDCQGINNGAIDLSIEGGTAPFTFLWGNGATDQNLSNLLAGSYYVTVTDANGCSESKLIPLYNQTNVLLDAMVTQPSCQDGTSGSIVLTVSGGAEPYIYSWSNGDETATIEGLGDGYYRVNVADQNGCSISQTYGIVTDMGIDAFSSVTKSNCFDDPVGEIDLTISGGTEPYSIEWSNGATTEDITGLTSGNYTATITDAIGCEITYKASVMMDNIIIGYSAISIPSCAGAEDGAIDIYITNGTEPYEITWSNGSSTEDISGLAAGQYTVFVSDASGCTSEKTINLPDPSPIQITHDVATNKCTGSQDISLNASGGSMEYTYSWSDGSTSDQLMDATPGTYTVTVTDTKSCSSNHEIVVEEPIQDLACLISDPASDIMCGSTNNTLTSDAPGAISYSWSISSSDNSWGITSSSATDQLQFSAGSAGSSAMITLTVGYEGGCEISCEKVIEVCIDNPNQDDGTTDDGTSDDGTSDDGTTGDGSTDDGTTDNGSTDDGNSDDGTTGDGTTDDNSTGDDSSNDGTTNDGSGDDGSSDDGSNDDSDNGTNDNGDNEDPVVDKECDECFFTYPVEISEVDGGYQYAIEVGASDCRYDLSHLTIEIPECYDLVEYSNSMDWKMEVVHNDPTTGLSGIKIDDIPSFGKDADLTSFMVYLKLTAHNDECFEKLACFAPIIAYKAATCVYEELTTSQCADEQTDYAVSTYPNPTHDYVKIDMDKCDKTASYTADLLDFHGEKIESYQFHKGFNEEFRIDLSSKKDGLYLLQIRSSKGDHSIHRVIKKS